jgi:uncharacterized membrane protein
VCRALQALTLLLVCLGVGMMIANAAGLWT